MTFAVSEWLRRRREFDLDNLVTPVLRAVYGDSNRENRDARCALWSWRATLVQAPTPFLIMDFIENDALTTLEHDSISLLPDPKWTGPLPTNSQNEDKGLPEWVRRQLGEFSPAEHHRFGVQIAFADSIDITRPEEKPIKPVVDCLYPIFGGEPGCAYDWKKLILQVERRVDLGATCHIQCWLLNSSVDQNASAPPPLASKLALSEVRHESSAATVPRRNAEFSTLYDKLDEAARQLGSPPTALHFGDILTKLRALFPETEQNSPATLRASLDFQTINIRGRAHTAGDFDKRDRWNSHPAFVKNADGTYQRLSDTDREKFQRRWAAGGPTLREPGFTVTDWDRLKGVVAGLEGGKP